MLRAIRRRPLGSQDELETARRDVGAAACAAGCLGAGTGRYPPQFGLNEPLAAEIDLVAPTPTNSAASRPSSRRATSSSATDWTVPPTSIPCVSASASAGMAAACCSCPPRTHGRALRHLPGGSELAARPPAARVHRPARPAGFRARAAAPPAPVAAPRVAGAPARTGRGSAPAPTPERAACRPRQRPFPVPHAGGAVPGGSYRCVRRYAVRNRRPPGDGDRASTNRMMIALFRANPEALPATSTCSGGRHAARAGARGSAVDQRAEAASEIGRQMGAWQSGRVSASPPGCRLVTPEEAPAEALPRMHGASDIEARIQSLSARSTNRGACSN
jgi:hypothetical protein